MPALPDRDRHAFLAGLLAGLPDRAADQFVGLGEWVREIERCLKGSLPAKRCATDLRENTKERCRFGGDPLTRR